MRPRNHPEMSILRMSRFSELSRKKIIFLATHSQIKLYNYINFSFFTACGNGLEFVKLKDAQFDATTSYAHGPNEAVKVQSRIDHMPSMGQVNNTKGRGIYLSIYYIQIM